MKKGIFLVANKTSQNYCENLVYSIRKSGCRLPIRLIHFGGEKVNSKYVLNEVEFLTAEDFSEDAIKFIQNLSTVLTDCPVGYLYRFLAWFSDWDQFIYSDNDIVALMNWERLFEFIEHYDLVHADEEYTTKGVYNYFLPSRIEEFFGKESLNTAVTAGHMLINKRAKMIVDINSAIEWFKQNPDVPIKHDQSLLHVATLLGNWKILNLCKQPLKWLSSWSGDYCNNLDLIHAIQGAYTQNTVSYKLWFSDLSQDAQSEIIEQNVAPSFPVHISHLHYSGRIRLGNEAIDDLMLSIKTNEQRLTLLAKYKLADLFYVTFVRNTFVRIKRKLKYISKNKRI